MPQEENVKIAFSRTLVSWFAEHARQLPWRGDGVDAYHVWVSEVILQQTRVAQGLDYYLRFVDRFPDVGSLAAADEREVMQMWKGLGYYSRARNMHAAARSVVEHHGGVFPSDYAAVRSLRGVGDYTAAAICSIAYGLPVAVVDGNVLRVLARYLAVDEDITSTSGRKHFAELAQSMLSQVTPGLYNQAIMDFGALQCVPRHPDCAACPLVDTCLAYARGEVERFPVKLKKVTIVDRRMVYLFVTHAEALLMRRRTGRDIWRGLCEPLLLEPVDEQAEVDVPRMVERLFGRSVVGVRQLAGGMKHVLTHRRLWIDAYHVQLSAAVSVDGYEYVPLAEAERWPTPRPVTALLQRLSPRP